MTPLTPDSSGFRFGIKSRERNFICIQGCSNCCYGGYQLILLTYSEVKNIQDFLPSFVKSKRFEKFLKNMARFSGDVSESGKPLLDCPDFIDFQRNELFDFFIPDVSIVGNISLVSVYLLRSMYPTNRCVFLDPVENVCVVYPVRPHICRMYPFKVVLTRSKKVAEIRTLDRARETCLGLGSGDKINLAEIKETALNYMKGLSEHRSRLSRLICKRGLELDDEFLKQFESPDFMIDRKFSKESNERFQKRHEDFYKDGAKDDEILVSKEEFVDLYVEEGLIKPNESFMKRLAKGEITWSKR